VAHLLPALLTLIAVVHETNPGPRGVPFYVITCPGLEAACYNRAAQVCPAGYEVVMTDLPGMVRKVGSGGVAVGPLHVLAIECR